MYVLLDQGDWEIFRVPEKTFSIRVSLSGLILSSSPCLTDSSLSQCRVSARHWLMCANQRQVGHDSAHPQPANT